MIILKAKFYLIILSIVFLEKNVDFTSFHLKIAPAFKSKRNTVVKLSHEWQILRITYPLDFENILYLCEKIKIKTLCFFLY